MDFCFVDYNEYVDTNTLIQIKNNFLSVLQQAASGQQTSLPFIRHQLPKIPLVKSGDTFQVLVIGGSVCQKATMKKDGDELKIISHHELSLPPFLTRDDFMTFLGAYISRDAEVIALNLAYPLTPTLRGGMLDGILRSGSKENTFDGLVGMQVGDEIEKYMKNTQARDIKVCVANDVICLLMSGLTRNEWSDIAAGIVGTGLNFAIFLDEHVIVNLESADFTNFPQSQEGKEIDKLSVSPGTALFEKETSGAYIYKHFNLLAKKRNMHVENVNSGEELSKLLTNENIEVAALAREVYDHSASLVAVQMAGILEFAKRDLTFIMQGSLFWKVDEYRESVDHFVSKLTPNYHATYKQVVQSDLIGAARLVC